ncbi:NAD(FAD)-utilizing dehydrogenase, sll0175 homolog [Lachnospiraceae bacterium KM106-2]|nr:NAD(FAD)-utilizing dehydrogenase, sll0175 homolog [Lachnospiraceae bacterium KM106-2]
MIRLTQIKIPVETVGKHKEAEQEELRTHIMKMLRISAASIKEIKIVKRSIDARKKNDIRYIYAIDVVVDNENKILHKCKNPNVTKSKDNHYRFRPTGDQPLTKRPIIIGTGPAGLFCAYMLAKEGYNPIVLERGEDVDTRMKDVTTFWETNKLNPNSNVQFGEGGAGTFSDGKLNTMVKDELGRGRKVLETFVEHGAPEQITFINKPHIGTDHLVTIVKSMREEINHLGGEVRFHSTVTDFIIEKDEIKGVIINGTETLLSDIVVLAIGHSSRDTFEVLHKKGIDMSKKSFAIGVRIEHPQDIIDHAQYGEQCCVLPAADYKLTYQAKTHRSIYSFCMCPGGFVVNSSSEEGHLVVNGMSNYLRNEKNANSAMIVGVNPEDFEDDSPLAGVNFQRKWEKLAYEAGKGLVPIQLFGDLCQNRESTTLGGITPNLKGNYTLSNLTKCLPNYVTDTLIEGIQYFNHKIPGFSNEEAILSGVETRTSSPVRITRDEQFEASVSGLYPCGEGAGYAGGITSAAMDGIKVYEAIASKYRAK